jgi:hypothetical protein
MKTNNLVKPILVVALLIAALASFLAGTPTASAQEPEPITVELHGSTRLNGPAKEKTFEVPAGYSSTGNINGQKREGHPEKGCTPAPNEKGIHNWCDQLQDNEEIRVKLNDQECFVDWDRNPEDDQWFDFEHTCPVKKGINVLTVEHTGRGTSKGSVHYDLELKVMPVEPVLCKNLSVTPDKGPAPLTV